MKVYADEVGVVGSHTDVPVTGRTHLHSPLKLPVSRSQDHETEGKVDLGKPVVLNAGGCHSLLS